MPRLNKRYVDNQQLIASGQALHWDDKLPGFGLVVGKTAKTFIVQFEVHGKTRRKKVGRYSEALTIDLARGKAKEWLGQLALGVIPWEVEAAKREQGITLKDAYDRFTKNKANKKKLSPATLKNYKYNYSLLKPWHKKELSKITPGMVSDLHTKLGTDNGTYLANAVMRLFRNIYNDAAKLRRELPANPVTGLEWYKEKRRQNAMPADVLPAFWELLDTKIDTPMRRNFYRLTLFTGLRRTSACSIQVKDIDLKTKTLHIPNPKGGEEKAFTLPLSDYLCELIAILIKAAGDSTWLFPSKTARSGHMEEPKEQGFTAALEKETGYHLMVHSLRNTFATVAESLDISHYAIKLLVNHSLPKSDVTGGYINPDVERLREPMQRITSELLRLVTPAESNIVELRK